MRNQRVIDIQQALQDQNGVDGWLFYDFRGNDPLAYRLLGLDPSLHVTRRWYYWIPNQGQPIKLVHRIEPYPLQSLPGETRMYVSWEEQKKHLENMLKDCNAVVMQYSPLNAIPYLSRVDAGTMDLIRSFGVNVLTSADLVQRFEAVWDGAQLASHREAADKLRQIVDDAFSYVRRMNHKEECLTEYLLQQFILSRMDRLGLTTSSPPIVAVNANSADPHYTPVPEKSEEIRREDFLLIDLWAKERSPRSVYADITWTGYVGTEVPANIQKVFSVVRAARDAAISYVQSQVGAGRFPGGWEVDRVCREVIEGAGFGNQFLHRTGHSIGEEVHGNGANIDNLETKDERRLLPHTCFSIEPGVYLTGEFGVRSEVDVVLSDREVLIFGQPIQTEVIPLMKAIE